MMLLPITRLLRTNSIICERFIVYTESHSPDHKPYI
jgi:hypothetical protein